jgi:glycerol-3-phosphate acyltransferase PlsY
VLAVRLLIAGDNSWIELIAAIAAVLGHSFSVFIGFKGGRGVLTGFGATVVTTPLAPVLMLIAFGVGAVLVATTRYVSLGSIAGATLAGLLMCWLAVSTGDPAWAVWGVLISGFIVAAHKDNIERLLAGTERKLGERVERGA